MQITGLSWTARRGDLGDLSGVGGGRLEGVGLLVVQPRGQVVSPVRQHVRRHGLAEPGRSEIGTRDL